MAHFLTTKKIAAELESIIRNAKEFVCIVTYSLKIDKVYIDRLRTASRKGVKIAVLFGVDENKVDLLNELWSIPNIQLHVNNSVHAKLYMNENSVLVTSMNLYDYSEDNNVEYGVLLHKNTNPEAYKEARTEIKDLIQDSRRILYEEPAQREVQRLKPTGNINESGFCIRCGNHISYNTDKPLCYGCYDVWAAYANIDYIEDFCHCCGEHPPITQVSFAKPLCYPCFMDNL